MRYWVSFAALVATVGCSAGPSENAQKELSADEVAGVWRSVTPSYEFIRLTISSKSSEMGVFATRLTFSGVAWEGSGRIEGDSLAVAMMMAGTTVSIGGIVVHVSNAQSLRVQVRPAAAAAIDLTLVREN